MNHHMSHAIPSRRSILSTRAIQFAIPIEQNEKFESMNSRLQKTRNQARDFSLSDTINEATEDHSRYLRLKGENKFEKKKKNQPGISDEGALLMMMKMKRSLLNGEIDRERRRER